VLRGGNLAVLHGLRGTAYDFAHQDNTILLIEDIGERPYQVERMLYSLKLSGVLQRLQGLLVGCFTEYTEDGAIGSTLYEMIYDLTSPYGYPVSFGFPVGHTDDNTPLILGMNYELRIKNHEGNTHYETILIPLPT
jgi:muramoyltetrapeptide carboxypeptidase